MMWNLSAGHHQNGNDARIWSNGSESDLWPSPFSPLFAPLRRPVVSPHTLGANTRATLSSPGWLCQHLQPNRVCRSGWAGVGVVVG